jgi:hypothetical protein
VGGVAPAPRGPPLRQALGAAAHALFPDRGRALRARVQDAVAGLFRRATPKPVARPARTKIAKPIRATVEIPFDLPDLPVEPAPVPEARAAPPKPAAATAPKPAKAPAAKAAPKQAPKPQAPARPRPAKPVLASPEPEEAPTPTLVRVRGRPPRRVPATGSPMERLAGLLASHPRAVFVVLCVAAGMVLGLLGAAVRGGRVSVARAETAPIAAVEPVEERTAPPPVAEKPRVEEPPPVAATPPPAREQPKPAAPKPPAPRRSQELPPETIDAVIRRLGGKPPEREEAERFLIWYREQTHARLVEALRGELAPEVRASIDYVLAAIEEERNPRPAVPFVMGQPPREGLVLFCDSLDGRTDDIAAMRRTAKAIGLTASVVLAAPDAAAVVAGRAAELGDVNVYPDPDRTFVKQMRVERLPAVAGLRQDGRAAFVIFGPVQRARLADQAQKLVR